MGDEKWERDKYKRGLVDGVAYDTWSSTRWRVLARPNFVVMAFVDFVPTVAEARAVLRHPHANDALPRRDANPITREELLAFVRSSGDPELCESVTPAWQCPGCGCTREAHQDFAVRQPSMHVWGRKCLAECIGNVAACPVCKDVLDEAAVHPAPGGVATHLECLERGRPFQVGDRVRGYCETGPLGAVIGVKQHGGAPFYSVRWDHGGEFSRYIASELTLVSPAKLVEVPEWLREQLKALPVGATWRLWREREGNDSAEVVVALACGCEMPWFVRAGGDPAAIGGTHIGRCLHLLRVECPHATPAPTPQARNMMSCRGCGVEVTINNIGRTDGPGDHICVRCLYPERFGPTPQEAPTERRFVGCESCEVMVLESAAHEVAADTHLCPACFSGRATPYVHEGATATNPIGLPTMLGWMPDERAVLAEQMASINAKREAGPRKGDLVTWDDVEAPGRRGLVVSTRTHTEVEREGPKLYLSIRFARGEEPKWVQASKCTVVQKRESL